MSDKSKMPEDMNRELFAYLHRIFTQESLVLSRGDIRALVDTYYELQNYRISSDNQIRMLADEPHEMLSVVSSVFMGLEKEIASVLKKWCAQDPVSAWAMKWKGLGGGILVAGMAAYIDIEIARWASCIYRLGGMANDKWLGKDGAAKIVEKYASGKKPDLPGTISKIAAELHRKADSIEKSAIRLGKGKLTKAALISALAKRPWNPRLKTILWKIGKSFVFTQNRGSFYGRKYREFKDTYIVKNEEGGFAETAASEIASGRNLSANQRTTYKAGKLPDDRIDKMAMRKATKIFICHWWEKAFIARFGEKAYLEHVKRRENAPWIIAHGGHDDFISIEEAEEYERNYRKEHADEDRESEDQDADAA